MRVALITSWDERCGIAEYGRLLIESVLDHDHMVDFTVINRHCPIHRAVESIRKDCDLAVLNFEPGILGHWNEGVIRGLGKPTILILHTSHGGDNRSNYTNAFTRVVVHEKTHDGFTHIPMGILSSADVAGNTHGIPYIGTAGFPFPKKGFHQVALAAERLGWTAAIIAPESRHFDTYCMKKVCVEANPRCQYETGWHTMQEIIRDLSVNMANVFPYNGNDSGISGAVRMGLAARRPIVLTRDRQFNDLFEYDDEIEFISSNDPEAIECGVMNALLLKKYPKRVLNEMSWYSVGKKYLKLFEETR